MHRIFGFVPRRYKLLWNETAGMLIERNRELSLIG